MRKIVKISDGLITPDDLHIKQNQTGFDTCVIITAKNCKNEGSQEIKVCKNKTVLLGRVKLLEDNFPIKPDMSQHLFINSNVLGEFDPATGDPSPSVVAHNDRLPSDLFRRRKVEYWCAGDGAINGTVYNTSWPPHSTDTKLYNMIPFRFIPVSDTLPNDIRNQYKMEVIYPSNSRFAGWKGYYFKKINFNDTDGIQMMVDGKPYTPTWADTAKDPNAETVGGYVNSFKGDKVQTNYIDMGMKISAEEFKEWFNFIDKSLENASISEIGLITGLDAFKDSDGVLTPVADLPESTANLNNIKMNSEIYDAELFAHLTFDPYSVARDNSTIDFQYRIYS